MRQAGLFIFAEVADLGIVLQWDKGTRVVLKADPKWKGRVRHLHYSLIRIALLLFCYELSVSTCHSSRHTVEQGSLTFFKHCTSFNKINIFLSPPPQFEVNNHLNQVEGWPGAYP